MTDNNVSYNTQNPNIQSCLLTTSTGSVHNLKDMFIELSYHEDIFGFSSSGYLLIQDGRGLIEALQLKGVEELELRFDKANDESDKSPLQKFIIYTPPERKPSGMYSSEFYKLHFCTKDFLTNSMGTSGKSYKGKKIYEMVEDILKNKLGTTENRYIQTTTGYYDIIVPEIKPFQAISWLSNIARPENSGLNGTTGADMLFFHNRYGYFFTSLNAMMKSEPYNEYSYQQNNLSSDAQDMQSRSQSVLNFEIVKSFNTLKDISSGAYANKTIGLNLLTGQSTTKVFDYSKYIVDLPPSNVEGVLPPIVNGYGELPNMAYNSKINFVITNDGHKKLSNYKKSPESVNEDLYMADVVSIRKAQIDLMQRTVIKIVVPGDSHLTVGKTINFNYYSLSLKEQKDSRDLDQFYSGKYLITAVRHIIQSQGVFQTVLELSRDGPTKGYTPSNGTGS